MRCGNSILSKAESKYQEEKDVLATKQDIAETKQDLAGMKVNLIKWMVGLWLTEMAAIIGLYLHK